MLHGFTATKDSWCKLAGYLSSNYHIVVIDLPGHGETTRIESDDFRIQSQVERIKQVKLVNLTIKLV